MFRFNLPRHGGRGKGHNGLIVNRRRLFKEEKKKKKKVTLDPNSIERKFTSTMREPIHLENIFTYLFNQKLIPDRKLLLRLHPLILPPLLVSLA